MAFLQCPNSDCGSHGPFEVTELPGNEEGQSPHKVLQCPLCSTVLAVLEPNHDMGFPAEAEQAIRRLETSVRAIQSNLTHLRGQMASLQGRIGRRI